MNKNIKIVSSLALAGILATSGLAGLSKVSAVEANGNSTPSLGKYATLGGVENVVPYILNQGAKVTVGDLKNEFGSISLTNNVLSDDAVVGTGTKFKSGNTTYTVLVYGDTNGDGLVDSDDAFDMLSHYVGTKSLSGIYLEAGNVEDTTRNDVDSDDAYRTKSFYVGTTATSRDKKPAKVEPVEDGYTLTVGENNVINNVNEGTLAVSVKLDSTLAEPKENLSIRFLDENNKEVAKVDASDIGAHVDQALIASLATNDEDNVNLIDGTYTVELIETVGSKEKVLARTTVEKNTEEPSAVKVSTVRTGWNVATLSLENGANNISKVYYVVLEADEDAEVPKFKLNENTNKMEFASGTTYEAPTSNNALKDEKLKEALKANTEYTVYYVLENTYGSRSIVKSADIKDGTQTSVPTAVDKATIKLPDLSKGETDITWTAPKGATTYSVVVYKDGNVVKEEKDVADAKYTITSITTDEDLGGAGKYKIEIAVNAGENDKQDSAYVMSDEVVVKAVNKAESLKYEVIEDGNTLTWKNTNPEGDVTGYTVNIYPYVEEDEAYSTTAVEVDEDDITEEDGTWTAVLTMAGNTAYRAEIVAIAATENEDKEKRYDIVDSDKAELEGFFNVELDATDVYDADKTTSNTVTLNIESLKDVTIKGGKLGSYRVEAYQVNLNHKPTEPMYVLARCSSKVEGDNIVVSGLTQNTNYVFKLYASVNGKEGQSEYIMTTDSNDALIPIKTYRTSPEVKGKYVVSEEADAKAGTVLYDGATLKIDGGEAIDLTDNYSKEFTDSLAVIAKLNDGDTITLDGDTITLDLGPASNGTAIDFEGTVKDKIVNVNGKGYSCEIAITSGSEAKELNLSGAEAKFTLTNANAKRIALNSDVVVDGDAKVVVLPRANVTINGVKVYSKLETEINTTETDKTLNVTVSGNVNNDLVFENLTDNNIAKKNAVIKFVGDGTLKGQQLGTIVIKTNNGKVTVSSDNINVDSKLTVDVNKGSVDIKDTTLTGNKTITVTHSENDDNATEITVKLAKKLPFTFKENVEEVAVKEYDNKTDVEGVEAIEGETTMDDIKQFLNDFNLTEDADATLKLDPDAGDDQTVILTINGNVEGYTIPSKLINNN